MGVVIRTVQIPSSIHISAKAPIPCRKADTGLQKEHGGIYLDLILLLTKHMSNFRITEKYGYNNHKEV